MRSFTHKHKNNISDNKKAKKSNDEGCSRDDAFVQGLFLVDQNMKMFEIYHSNRLVSDHVSEYHCTVNIIFSNEIRMNHFDNLCTSN